MLTFGLSHQLTKKTGTLPSANSQICKRLIFAYMIVTRKTAVDKFMELVERRNPHQPEFYQAVYEVALNVIPFIEEHPQYKRAAILERIIEPERILIFRVPWIDDNGYYRVNRGYRVQMNSAIGPYKGGLRFHSEVTLDTLKFLAFEQVFKNSYYPTHGWR